MPRYGGCSARSSSSGWPWSCWWRAGPVCPNREAHHIHFVHQFRGGGRIGPAILRSCSTGLNLLPMPVLARHGGDRGSRSSSTLDGAGHKPGRKIMRTFAILIFGGVLGLTACGAPVSGKVSEDLTIGMSVSTLSNPYFVQFRDGAEAGALRSGVKLTVTNAHNDPAQQARQIKNFTEQHVKTIILNPVDADAVAPAVKAAGKAGIPVIAADRSVNGSEVAQTVTSDNVAGGKQGARELAKQLSGKGDVVVLQGAVGASASRDRDRGFTDGVAAYPKIKVIARRSADFNRAKGRDVMTSLIQRHPDITGVFASNDEMALGAIQALGTRAGRQVKVVGFDGTPDGIKAVRAGTMAATVAQQPRLIGSRAVNEAIKAARGQVIAKSVAVPIKLAIKDNAHEFWTF
ncbi:D-ribose ABC transporter substrate-binding protein [Nonomuraea cypriaca]|nr:D-ribose ABC transporter substrate-binding protein [Nonomuraea cypriaca]